MPLQHVLPLLLWQRDEALGKGNGCGGGIIPSSNPPQHPKFSLESCLLGSVQRAPGAAAVRAAASSPTTAPDAANEQPQSQHQLGADLFEQRELIPAPVLLGEPWKRRREPARISQCDRSADGSSSRQHARGR